MARALTWSASHRGQPPRRRADHRQPGGPVLATGGRAALGRLRLPAVRPPAGHVSRARRGTRGIVCHSAGRYHHSQHHFAQRLTGAGVRKGSPRQREEYPMTSSQHAPSKERGIELLHDPQRNKSHGLHRGRAGGARPDRAAALRGGGRGDAGPAGAAAARRQANRSGALHLPDRAAGHRRGAVLQGGHVRSGAVLPILYDPTVGEACLKFGHIYRRPRGLYLSVRHQGRMAQVLRNSRPATSG